MLNTLINADCDLAFLSVPDASVDLVFADPPFNIGYKYDVYEDEKRAEEYLSWTHRWMGQAMRVLKPEGSPLGRDRRRVRRGDQGPGTPHPGAHTPRLDRMVLHLRRPLHQEVHAVARTPPLLCEGEEVHLQRQRHPGAQRAAAQVQRPAGEPRRPRP